MKRFYLLSVISLFSAGISAQEITGGERTLSADSIITSDARLDSIYQSLPEVMITGERPVVKASQGKLVYDLPRLIRDLPVDNAYDAVKELPGVTEMNGGLQLAGQEEHEKALESLDKALELIKKMENSEAEVATTHVNRALSLMALGRLDEADEELKESLTFYASPEGVQSGHFGSALAAAGELAWRRGNYDQAIGLLEKALMVTQSRFGESDACAVIRQNLEMIKKEKEEKGITGAADKKEDKGGNPSHCASCQFKDAKF